ncbi:hypothetical protein F3Y22_tig00110332pilonHSYRG01504 [Hibiscus syriacus]|uniref:DEAD-box RNA helicase Q domain-containing protein n=1 Tax=Hibiscus syriacus TaxID=106335 RepID=A0A6A3B2G0_HIBSY|nr:hypothetical protein F3Y22_tig00110332pilonHSYRG01504 [Hibiscus syriacus]
MGSSKRKRKSGTWGHSGDLDSLKGSKGKRIRVVWIVLVMLFDQLSLSPLSLKGVKDAGYEKMTLVQEATLPAILQARMYWPRPKQAQERL